jgi:glucuronoarabinoxylan endo-1,4-beta-xylanase
MKETMRVRRILFLVGLSTSACILRKPEIPEGPVATVVITLRPGERHQTLEGFGASIAWYHDRVVGSPPRRLYQVLFPDLGLDILRLRNRFQRTEYADKNLNQEVEILRRAREALGHPPKIMLASWSPPAALKANGSERCRSNDNCTLRRDSGQFAYDRFADYWRASLEHYASLGIVPDWISLQNEPDFIPPDWEGCKFTPTETGQYPGYDRALEAVKHRLSGLASPPKLVGPDVVGVHWHKVSDYVKPLNLDLLDGVSHHLYEKGNDGVWDWRSPGPDSYVPPMKEAAAAAQGKPLFETEFGTEDDRGTEGGFETASLIHHSLVEEGVVAFLYWNLIWESHSGLVSVGTSSFKIRDQYYSLKHYARFTDPGYVRVGARSDSGDVRASAFLSPSGDQLTLVLLNAGPQAKEVRVDPGGFAVQSSAVYRTTYRPGKSRAWEDLESQPAAPTVLLLSRSVATVVLTGHG